MQMAKVSAVLSQLAERRIPTCRSSLTDDRSVSASYAMLGMQSSQNRGQSSLCRAASDQTNARKTCLKISDFGVFTGPRMLDLVVHRRDLSQP